jgi:hypothetical protein
VAEHVRGGVGQLDHVVHAELDLAAFARGAAQPVADRP